MELTFARVGFTCIAVPLVLWALASVFAEAATRTATRSLASRCVWIHLDSQRLLRAATFALLALVVAVSAVWGTFALR